ncbi:MAG: insulinase family protein, partial [Verrucomicrobiota bacterium]
DLPPTEQVLTLLEETLAPLPTGQALNHRIDATLPATPGEHLYHLDREQAVLTIGLRGLSFDSPDTAAAELFQEHTSNMAGPLFTRIREELGLAYYVSSNQFHGLGTGLFSLYLGTSPDQLPLARTELENTHETIATKGLTQTDLDRARIATLSGLDIEAQSPSAQARSAALDTLLGLGLQHSQQHRQALETLTVDQLNTFIPTLLTQQKVTSIVQPPPPQR